MAFEYEALIGHLYIVGRRSINASPPGLLVEAAPRKAARGREMDTFFTLILPTATAPAPASFYEEMARLASEEYFNSSGSVTAGVRAVFNTLNLNLLQHNQSGQRRYEAQVICAILHGDDLFLARVGGGLGVLLMAGETQLFPSHAEPGASLFGAALGMQATPDIRMSQYRLQPGTRLILTDNNAIEFDITQVGTALQAQNLGEVILSFKALAQDNLTLLAAEFVPPDVPAAIVQRESQSTRQEQPPAEEAPIAEATPETSAVSLALQETNYRIRHGASNAAIKLADGLENLNSTVEKINQAQAARPSRFGRLLSSGSVVLIPIALVVLVLIMWLGGTSASEFDICVNSANEATALARSVASSDVTGTLAAWNAVLVTIESCNQLRPDDAQLTEIQREGQTIIDRLNEIQRREVIPIEAFPNASLSSIVLRGEDLYVLDEANDLVYRVTLAENGLGIVPNSRQPIATMRRGASVNQFTLSSLIDITWAEDGSGLSQGNVLLALDDQGVLVEYSPTFIARGAQRLLGSETWKAPTRMVTWRGRLYLLDPAADQIWRYDPSGGAYPGSPLEYFTGPTRPSLQNAVDFSIDDNGRIYILFSDGVIAMFRSGEELPFGFADFPANQPLSQAMGMFLNTNPVSPGMYLVDRQHRTVFETTLAGTFINSYRAFDETLFAGLADVTADESKKVIYVLSGNSILGFTK